MSGVITITFGEQVENHVGNQQIGDIAKNGLSCQDLKNIQEDLQSEKFVCQYFDLAPLIDDQEEAAVLVIRNFLSNMESGTLFNSLRDLDWDKQALMKGRVVNKKARFNLCFADFNQEPDYAGAKGRVYKISDIQSLNDLSKRINILADSNLLAEGNFYYDTDKCYIGFHGDSERKIVFGVRLGDNNFPLFFRGFKSGKKLQEQPFKIVLNAGDLYIMSQKAVGTDWKKRNVATLRHAAGNLSSIPQ